MTALLYNIDSPLKLLSSFLTVLPGLHIKLVINLDSRSRDLAVICSEDVKDGPFGTESLEVASLLGIPIVGNALKLQFTGGNILASPKESIQWFRVFKVGYVC